MRKQFGIVTPVISPFINGSIDHEAVSGLVGFVRKNGVKGIFPAGSTGCAPLLSKEQHIGIINAYADADCGPLKLFPGIGRNSIAETQEVARAAVRSGCDAVVLVTPYYLRLDRGEVVRYYDSLLSKIDHEVIAYNIPQLTGNTIDAQMFNELSKRHRNLIGVKDSSKDTLGFSRFCKALPDQMLIFQGEDDLLLRSMSAGASGGVCGTTNFSRDAVLLFNAYLSRRFKEAEALQKNLVKTMRALSSHTFPMPYHYLFYRKVMGREALNMPEPFPSKIDESLRRLAKYA